MGLQFEWWVGDRDQSERIAKSERRKLPRWVWAVLRVALACAIVLAGGGYLGMRLLYERARRRALTQIRETIEIEARAFAAGKDDLYLAQQDRAAVDWYRLQARCVAADSPIPGELVPARLQDLCFTPATTEIEDLELRGDIAWVQVRSIHDGPSPVRRVRFFRRTDQGWKHTAPRAEFWGDPVRSRHGKILIGYHERDRPAIDPFLERITRTADGVSSALLYTLPVGKARIEFVTEPSVLARGAAMQGDRMLLLSPWLSGIPVDGTWDEASLDSLTYQVAHGLALAATRSSDNRALGQIQRAISSEYAAWYTTQDPAQAPLLGRIIERHGTEVLPRMFLSIKGASNTTLFLIRWLSVHPKDDGFFETVLNIEREAIAVGQKETFLLFQDEAWLSEQAKYFDQAQVESPYSSASPIEVLDASLDDRAGYAAVRVREPFIRLQGYAEQTDGENVIMFRRDNWDWRHTAHDAPPLQPPAVPPTPAPDQSP